MGRLFQQIAVILVFWPVYPTIHSVVMYPEYTFIILAKESLPAAVYTEGKRKMQQKTLFLEGHSGKMHGSVPCGDFADLVQTHFTFMIAFADLSELCFEELISQLNVKTFQIYCKHQFLQYFQILQHNSSVYRC